MCDIRPECAFVYAGGEWRSDYPGAPMRNTAASHKPDDHVESPAAASAGQAPAPAHPPAPVLADYDVLGAEAIERFADDPGLRHRAGTRSRRTAGALRQEAANVDCAGQPSHRYSARRGAAQPAHAGQPWVRVGRRRPPLLPAAAGALVQPRLPVGVAAGGRRPADSRPAGRDAARGLLAGDPRRRRDRLPRALGVVAHHVAVAQRRAPAAGVLHVDRPRAARAPAAAGARRLPRAHALPALTPSTR